MLFVSFHNARKILWQLKRIGQVFHNSSNYAGLTIERKIGRAYHFGFRAMTCHPGIDRPIIASSTRRHEMAIELGPTDLKLSCPTQIGGVKI